MQKSRRNACFLTILLLVGPGVAACGPISTTYDATTATVRPTVTVSATSQATARVTPTLPTPSKTPEPTATLQPQSAQPSTPIIEATPASLALKGPTVSYNGIRFNVDPVLGDTVYAHMGSIGVVNYTRFTFAPDGLCREIGCVEVYPVAQYQEAFPDWPLPPVGAATILRAQDKPLSFQNGAGARSIRMRGQDGFFANNEDLAYDFQGFTADEQYYVSIIVPIDAPLLLNTADPEENANPAAILPQPDEDEMTYNQRIEQQLDLLALEDFAPSLSVLDALAASLQIEPPPENAPLPPAAKSVGPFRLVSALPPALSGDVVSLRVAPDGRPWVATTYGFAVWQDGRWQTYPPTDFRIQDLLPAPGGTIWLAHDQGVFIFDGAGWTGLSLSDMGMRPPLDPDKFIPYTLERAGTQVWVGRCDWVGPGPLGGDVRWFDGTAWRGADSPVASSCVTTIREDGQGRVWVAANADLWQYDPAAGDWVQFAPPEPPEGYRFGFISDLAFDPAGQPWPLYDICGGASCGQMTEARYRLEDGAWVLVREEVSFPQRLIFDDTGTPWLFVLGGAVHRFQGDPSADTLVAGFLADAVTTDAAGRVWVVGRQVDGETAVWVLETKPTP